MVVQGRVGVSVYGILELGMIVYGVVGQVARVSIGWIVLGRLWRLCWVV